MIHRQTSTEPVCITVSAVLLRGSESGLDGRRGALCWWVRGGDVRDGPLAWRGGDWVSGCNDTLISGKTCQSSWQARLKLLSATAWNSERRQPGTDWEAARTNLGPAGEDLGWESERETGWKPEILLVHTHVCAFWQTCSHGLVCPGSKLQF